MKNTSLIVSMALLGLSISAVAAEQADEQAAELSKKLANPVSSLISIPIEYNTDADIGPSKDGEVKTIKFTPVVPFEVGENWNLITRTIFSYVDQDLPDAGLDETGLSDIVLSLYFSPKEVSKSGWIVSTRLRCWACYAAWAVIGSRDCPCGPAWAVIGS